MSQVGNNIGEEDGNNGDTRPEKRQKTLSKVYVVELLKRLLSPVLMYVAVARTADKRRQNVTAICLNVSPVVGKVRLYPLS